MRNEILNEYFDWLYDQMTFNRYSEDFSYRKLLSHLHQTNFISMYVMDENRALDGLDLRRTFSTNYSSYNRSDLYLDGPCSVLELMVALAIRCEQTIMDDTEYGDRTQQWFWDMLCSLGLGSQSDINYDRDYVSFVLDRFMKRQYARNGKGGLFTVNNVSEDLREMEIWQQMCLYINTIT